MYKHRYAVSLLLVILICFSACNNKSNFEFEPTRDTVYKFTLTHSKLSANGIITIKGPGCCEISFITPQALRYISYLIDSDTVTVYFGDHQKTFSFNEMPEGSVIRLLALSMEYFLFTTHSFSLTDNETVLAQSEILQQNVAAIYSKDGDLKRLDFTSSDFYVIFRSN